MNIRYPIYEGVYRILTINLTSEEFANRIEEMLDLASKGDNVLIHHEGKTYTVIPISDEELENLTAKEKVLLNK